MTSLFQLQHFNEIESRMGAKRKQIWDKFTEVMLKNIVYSRINFKGRK